MGAFDKIKNAVEEIVGKGKQAVGDATNNDDLKAEGTVEETKADLKQAVEKGKDALS